MLPALSDTFCTFYAWQNFFEEGDDKINTL